MACTRVFFKLENPSLPKGSRWGPLDGVQFIWARGNPGDPGLQRIPRLQATQKLQEQALFPKRLRGMKVSEVSNKADELHDFEKYYLI